MRRIALILSLIAAGAAGFSAAAGADDVHEYEIEMYNAFGIVEGSDVRIAGVNAGSVKRLDVNDAKRAIVTVQLTGPLSVLGEDTECSSEPQSLIAEYFINCEPDGPPIEEDDDATDPQPDIPASRVSQTVQPDLVANTLREPYKRRFQLIINEFGTALAGNPQNLNEAIRLGAPALRDLEKVLAVLAKQNRIIRDLNADQDRVISDLTDNREDVVRFIQEARDTAQISNSRREFVSANFNLLDDFLAELQPTLADLEVLAREQTPLLTDLRASAPGLNRLALQLPGFNDATRVSLESLGDAGKVGKKALNKGREEIDALDKAGDRATSVGEILADFLRDIDDESRIVEENESAAGDTGDPGREGYTGLEGLLNYAYYQAGALNQFDAIGHLLHFTLYYVDTGPCGEWTSGRDKVDSEGDANTAPVPNPAFELDGTPGLPKDGGGFTTNILDLPRCAGWLGPNQPMINEPFDAQQYHPNVCPDGTEPIEAEQELCDANPNTLSAKQGGAGGEQAAGSTGEDGPVDAPSALPDVPNINLPGGGGGGRGGLPRNLDDILDLPRNGRLPDRLRDATRRAAGGGGGGGRATQELLDYLFGP
jgi:ABC-type transporter Mla subunit MlaD